MRTLSRLPIRSSVMRAAMVAGLMLASLTSGAVWADQAPAVFEFVPKQADGYVLIPKLSGLSQKLATINDGLNLNQPPLADAMTEFRRQFGITAGLNDDGTLLIVFMKGLPTPLTPMEEKDILVFVPVNDYGAFVSSYRGNPNEFVTALSLPNERKGFARRIGNYALLNIDRRVLEEYKQTDIRAGLAALAGPLGLKCLNDSDISVIELGKAARTEVPAAFTPSTLILDPAQTIGIVGVDVSELGFGLSAVAKYKEGSLVNKYFSDSLPAAKYLARLPFDPNYYAAWDFSTTGLDLQPIMKMHLDNLDKTGDPNADIIRKGMELTKGLKGGAFVVLPSSQSQEISGSLFTSSMVLEPTDTKAYVQAIKDYINSMNAAGVNMNPADAGNSANNTVKFTTRYTSSALQVDGVNVDQYEINYNIPSSTLQQLSAAHLSGLAGGGGQNGYIAIVGNHVIVTTTPDAAVIRSVLVSLKAENGVGTSPMISQVRDLLPPGAVFETFISGSTVFKGVDFARGLKNLPAMSSPGNNVPPVAIGVSAESVAGSGGWMAKIFVPMPVAAQAYIGVLPLLGGADMTPDTTATPTETPAHRPIIMPSPKRNPNPPMNPNPNMPPMPGPGGFPMPPGGPGGPGGPPPRQ